MILNGIKYLFYSIYKITSINYGKDGGRDAALIIVSALFSLNAFTVVGLVGKSIFNKQDISLMTMSLIFLISLLSSFMLFFYRKKYKSIIRYFEEKKKKRIMGTLKILAYISISLGLFIMVVLM